MRNIVRRWSVLLVLLLASPAWSDATLKGVDVLNREHGTPVTGTEILAMGANVFTTGNDGVCALTFRDGLSGQDVSVRVNHLTGTLKAVESAPGSGDAWLAYAYFHQEQNHFAQARQGYEQALTLVRLTSPSNDAIVATTLNNLGILSRDENRQADARKQFEEALDIYRPVAARAPATYQPDVQLVENNLRSLPK